MRRRFRVRRISKWISTTLLAMAVACWVGSLWWSVHYANHMRDPGIDIWIESGYFNLRSVTRSAAIRWLSWEDVFVRMNARRYDGWHFEPCREKPSLAMLWGSWYYRSATGVLVLVIPLWSPVAVLVPPTALLCYLASRFPKPGHCGKCGYDLTGNRSGVCPECGDSVLPE
ncbi:MAG: hypothetical protein IT450_04735 [Phycisphaerales bacterium]|nr:hypothetical protein [Phycisphaerales bacterium]